jgi:ABC-type antimicrobial peptide transport system permease subunit
MRDGVEVGREEDALTTYRVVGVAGDVRRSLRRLPTPEIYVPLSQMSRPNLTVQARARDGIRQAAVTAAIGRAIAAVDSELPVNGAEPLEATIARQGIRPRFLATVLGGFAALAALAALVGVYAISAWAARTRRREAAIRLALGARPRHVIRMLTASGALAIVIGLAIGWWASLGLGRLLSSELTGVTENDVSTRLALAAALFCLCVLAVYRPARAVTKLSPATILRE